MRVNTLYSNSTRGTFSVKRSFGNVFTRAAVKRFVSTQNTPVMCYGPVGSSCRKNWFTTSFLHPLPYLVYDILPSSTAVPGLRHPSFIHCRTWFTTSFLHPLPYLVYDILPQPLPHLVYNIRPPSIATPGLRHPSSIHCHTWFTTSFLSHCHTWFTTSFLSHCHTIYAICFRWCSDSSKFVTSNSDYIRRLFITVHIAYASIDETKIV